MEYLKRYTRKCFLLYVGFNFPQPMFSISAWFFFRGSLLISHIQYILLVYGVTMGFSIIAVLITVSRNFPFFVCVKFLVKPIKWVKMLKRQGKRSMDFTVFLTSPHNSIESKWCNCRQCFFYGILVACLPLFWLYISYAVDVRRVFHHPVTDICIC